MRVGEIGVGALFALGLPDIINLDSVIDLLNTLSTIIALVLRNASLYEHQDLIIDERTAEVQAAYEEIRSELEERKEIEKRLREVSEFQESIISNARVWIMVIDQNSSVLLWNRAAEEITGYQADTVVGKKNIWRFLYPNKEYRKELTLNIRKIIDEKKYLENFETTIVTKGGMEKIISWNTKDIPQEPESPPRYIAIGVDVTDQSLAEYKLKVSEERFSDLFSKSQNAIMVYLAVDDGNNFLIVDFNPAAEQIDKVARDSVIGRLVTEVFPGIRDFGLLEVFQRGE